MGDVWFRIAGDLDPWPSRDEMARLLRAAGMAIYVGRYSFRIDDFEHFTFQEYGGDLGDPIFDAESDSLDSLLREAQRVSDALKKEGCRHRMELYDDENVLVGYVHHEWPNVR